MARGDLPHLAAAHRPRPQQHALPEGTAPRGALAEPHQRQHLRHCRGGGVPRLGRLQRRLLLRHPRRGQRLPAVHHAAAALQRPYQLDEGMDGHLGGRPVPDAASAEHPHAEVPGRCAGLWAQLHHGAGAVHPRGDPRIGHGFRHRKAGCAGAPGHLGTLAGRQQRTATRWGEAPAHHHQHQWRRLPRHAVDLPGPASGRQPAGRKPDALMFR